MAVAIRAMWPSLEPRRTRAVSSVPAAAAGGSGLHVINTYLEELAHNKRAFAAIARSPQRTRLIATGLLLHLCPAAGDTVARTTVGDAAAHGRWPTTRRRTTGKPSGYPSGIPVPDGYGYSSSLVGKGD
uniref:Uncharacterized protein n=1 Tax=Oryza punctata TaxID=4537 RepID=A0A0E0LMN4_ORYPU